MIDIDQNKKLIKFRKFQAHIKKDVEKKNRPKAWEEIDELQKQERQVNFSDDELSPQSKRKKIKKMKPDKNQFRQKQVAEYQNALNLHRSQKRTFHDPNKAHVLNLNIPATVKALEEAKDKDKDMALALKRIGLKSLKTLYVGGAKKQLEVVINFLRNNQIPKWIPHDFSDLMKKGKEDFKGTVKGYLRK